MPKRILDWPSVDKSDWGKRPDAAIARELGVDTSVIAYWRKLSGIPVYNVNTEREQKFAEGLHWCSKCQRYLPVENFGKWSKGRFGLKTHCFDCRKRYSADNAETIKAAKHEQYLRTKDRDAEQRKAYRVANAGKMSEYMKRRLEELRLPLVEMAGGACQRCGYSEFTSGLAFHHVDPRLKDTAPTKAIMSGNAQRTYAELDKCVLLCMNCHQSFHSGRWTGEFVKREGLGWTLKK